MYNKERARANLPYIKYILQMMAYFKNYKILGYSIHTGRDLDNYKIWCCYITVNSAQAGSQNWFGSDKLSQHKKTKRHSEHNKKYKKNVLLSALAIEQLSNK